MADEQIDRRKALTTIVGAVATPMLISCQEAVSASKNAKILQRIPSIPKMEGKGAMVRRLFPTRHLRHLDPFVLLDDFDVAAPAGFPMHPHRGFEAFTYMLEGAFHHKDNLGNDSYVTEGGIQRFTSGSGAWHSEMPGRGSTNHGLQLWVNLPKRLKKMDPEYQDVQAKLITQSESKRLKMREIVGPKAKADLKTSVSYLDIALAKNAVFRKKVNEGWNTLLYVLGGSLQIGKETIVKHEAVLLASGDLTVFGRDKSRFVFLSGKPHKEPIIQRGPFVD